MATYNFSRRVTHSKTLEALAACLIHVPELTKGATVPMDTEDRFYEGLKSKAQISAFENFNKHLPEMTKDQLVEVIKTLQELAFFDPLPALIHRYLTLVGAEACAEDFQKHFNNLGEIQIIIRKQYFYMFNKKLDDAPFTPCVRDFIDYGALNIYSRSSIVLLGSKAMIGVNTKKKAVRLKTMPLDELDLDGIERFFNNGTYTRLHLAGSLKNIKSTKGESLFKFLKKLTIYDLTPSFVNFPDLPDVEELSIRMFNGIKEEDFFGTFFKHFPNLKKLKLSFYNNPACKISLDSFNSLVGLKELQLYEIPSNFPTKFWQHLPQLTTIELTLSLDKNFIKELFKNEKIPSTLKKVTCYISPSASPKGLSDETVQEFQQSSSSGYREQLENEIRGLFPAHVTKRKVSCF